MTESLWSFVSPPDWVTGSVTCETAEDLRTVSEQLNVKVSHLIQLNLPLSAAVWKALVRVARQRLCLYDVNEITIQLFPFGLLRAISGQLRFRCGLVE